MSDVDHHVEIAFNVGPKDPLADAVWTDITRWVDEVDIDRGRQRKLTRVEAGTCTVQIEDEDGRFNPANTGSPYWPDVKPNRRIRVRATLRASATDEGGFEAADVTVGTTVTLLASAASISSIYGAHVKVRNAGTATMYIGGSGVTTADGFPLEPGDRLEADLDPAESLYAVVASGTETAETLSHATSVDYILFSGFVDRWPQAWPESEFVPVTIEATDGFKILAQKDLPASAWAHEVSEDSPTHWWRFAETAGTSAVDVGKADQTHDGTYVGSPALGAAGLVEHDSSDQAVELDGVDDEVTVDESVIPPGVTGTVELVLRIDSLPAAGQWMSIVTGPVLPGSVHSPPLMLSIDSDGEIGFNRTNLTEGFSALGISTPVTTGTHHVAFTWSGSTGKLYVDGVELGAGSNGLFNDATNQDLSFGGNDGRSEAETGRVFEFFDGAFGEAVFYDTALSAARVSAHASAVDAPWNGETSGARVGRVLDLADWPTADRDLDAGQTTFADANFNDDQTVLDYLHRCAESENGLFFINRNGDARFIERHASLTDTVYSESQATFSDSPAAGEYNYETFEPDYDDQLVNIATFQRKFGATQSAEDAASRAAYGDAELTRMALLMDTDAETKSAAEWVVAHNAEPRMEVRRIVVHPELNPNVWPEALGLDLLERVTVERTPKHGGDAFVQEASIQGVSHRIRTTDSDPGWVTGWWLSPVDTQAYWILGDSTYSVLGSTTRLAY